MHSLAAMNGSRLRRSLLRCAGGVNIPAGSILVVLNGAANRDPKHFDEPETFDPMRPNARRHIAFGRGVHSCPGALLARPQARFCIERLLDRTGVTIADGRHGPARGPPLRVRADVHPARPDRTAPRVHALSCVDRQHPVERALDAGSESPAHLRHGRTQPLGVLIGHAFQPHPAHPHRHHTQDAG